MRKYIDMEIAEINNVTKEIFKQMTLSQMRKNEIIQICDKIEDNYITPSFESDCYVVKMDNEHCQIQCTQMERRKYWDEAVGLETYMRWKRERIQELQSEGIPIYEDSFDDDGDYVHLDYYIDLSLSKGEDILNELTRIIEINIEETLQIKMDTLEEMSKTIKNRTII